MKTNKLISVLLVLMIGLIPISSFGLTPSSASPSIYIDLDKTTAQVNDIITASICINNITNFSGYSANIVFDPDVLVPVKNNNPYGAATSPESGNILKNQDFSPLSIAKNDIANGILNINKSYLGMIDYRENGIAETTGIVAVVRFKVLKNTATSIQFKDTSSMPGANSGTYLFDWNSAHILEYTVIQPPIINNVSDPTSTPTTEPTPTIEPTATPISEGVIGTGTGLKAEYFDSMDLTDIRFIRTDTTVNFDWGYQSPDKRIAPETYSVRWTGQVQPKYSGEYTFYVAADDGMRLWIDGKEIINDWKDHAVVERSGKVTLAAGQKYDIKLEYYDNIAKAAVKLMWSSEYQTKEIIPQSQLYNSIAPVQGKGKGLKGQYFDDMYFEQLKLTRLDSNIDFNWKGNSPHTSIQKDTFSVCWSGQIQAPIAGEYTISVMSDDGIRVWIDGKLLINHWGDHSASLEKKGKVLLSAGNKYDIKVDYYDNLYDASAKLMWEYEGTPKETIPVQYLYSAAGKGLKAEYFDNMDLTDIKLVRNDSEINFDWAYASPDKSIQKDTFSVRWSGELEVPTSEDYFISVLSDDGARVWLDGKLVIDHWSDHGASEKIAKMSMNAGQRYNIIVEYYDNSYKAICKLMWESPGISREIIPQNYLFSK